MRTLVSFDGHTINDTSYRSVPVGGASNLPAAELEWVNQPNNDPVYAGVFSAAARSLPIVITILNRANRATLAAQLKEWFKRGTVGKLTAVLEDGATYEMQCVVESLTGYGQYPGTFAVVLQGELYWKKSTASTDSLSADGTHLTKTITVGGAADTRLIVGLTPTGAASGSYQWQYLYQLVNVDNLKIGRRPWCIQLDTAALVTAGKCRADCYDLVVAVDGVIVPRWISGANTTATKIWFNVDIGMGYDLTLKTAVPNEAAGLNRDFVFQDSANNRANLRDMPAAGILQHGTEWLSYTAGGKNNKKRSITLRRGALGTTPQAHTTADLFVFIEHVITVLCGNATATDPAAGDAHYNDEKPIFDLSASSNTSWVYTATTGFYDAANPARPGSWTPTIKRAGDQSLNYLYTQNGSSGAPALGCLMSCWQRVGKWQNEQATIAWMLNCPGGIATVSMTGSKYRSTVRWPGVASLQRSRDGATWTSLWTEATPVSVSTWTAWTHASTSMGTNQPWVRLALQGSMAALASAAAYLEALTATVTFDSSYLPTGTLLAQSGNFPLAMRLNNTTTGEYIDLIYPMQLNHQLLVDGENYAITYDGLIEAHEAMTLDDESRDVWLRLVPGANALTIESDSMGAMTVALSWHERVA